MGLLHPILLVPADIMTRLTPHQLEAVLAHEFCDARRCHNLTAAIHMIVEAVFWFHPLVWWIGSRLVEERERACDEEVLRRGTDPQIYAEGILIICKSYLESRLYPVSGVRGSNLKKRIETILTGRIPSGLSSIRKVALVATGLAALVAPVVVGLVHTPPIQAQSQPPGRNALRAPRVARDPSGNPSAYLNALGSVAAFYTVTVKPRVDGQLMSVYFKEGDLVEASQIVGVHRPAPLSNPTRSRRRPANPRRGTTRRRHERPKRDSQTATGQITRLEGSIQADQANVDSASLAVEAWNRDDTAKIATGRLTAVDKRIDQTTRTPKLKAVFDNKDGKLFPNQLVLVRLFLNGQ